MTTHRYLALSCWLTSAAYAAGFKRVGRLYFVNVVAAITYDDRATVVWSGRLPAVRSTCRLPGPTFSM